MYIIEVIPLQHLPKNVSQILTYYYKEPIEKGIVVEISVQTKKILALVTCSTPIENLKNDLKSNTFTLKKLNKIVISKPIVDKSFWDIAKFISTYYYDDLTRVIKILLPNNLTSLIKYLNKPPKESKPIELKLNNNIEKLFNNNLYNNIINTFNQEKSILLAFPTESELNFYLNHFQQIFNNDSFVVLNKKVSTKNNNSWYQQLLSKQPKIIFGLRKTLGFPLNNLGSIYIFNSNDESYKSWDLRPYFNYENVLNWFHNKQKIPIYFQKNQIDIEQLKTLKHNINLFDTNIPKTNPKTEIIINQDYSKKDLLGYSLKKDFFKLDNNHNKWILFLNKKGFWNGVQCKDCKTILYCNNCNKPLTYFKTTKENYLKCSLCNQKTPIITTCPKCQSKNFEPTNLGIDKLEQNILDTLKDNHVKIFSIQSDDTEEHIDQTINQFMNSENGILIGTSAIFKPQISNIQNIAIINIDNLFSIPDFRTEEKVLTLIWKLKSKATKTLYIKTSFKNNPLFNTIKNNSFDQFWKTELSLRKKYILPPFSQIISIEYRNINQNTVKTTIETYFNKIKRTIEKNNLNDKFILTPISPSFHEKINNLYYYNFEIKMKLNDPFSISQTDIKMRNQLFNLLPSDFYIDVDPIN